MGLNGTRRGRGRSVVKDFYFSVGMVVHLRTSSQGFNDEFLLIFVLYEVTVGMLVTVSGKGIFSLDGRRFYFGTFKSSE